MASMGTGDYHYEIVEDFCKLPDGMSFGRVTGVGVDSRERVHVCQQLVDPPILMFDRDGQYLSNWGSGRIGEPHTIYVSPDDIFYLADRGDHVVATLTLEGETLVEMGNRKQPSDTGADEDEAVVLRAGGPFNRPTHLVPSPSGDLYVSDGYRNCRVHRYSADGNLIRSWGTPGGPEPGQIFSPHCLWIDGQGLVYVCDRKNDRIQVFSAEGDFVTQWTDIPGATDISMVNDETVYVCERQGDSGDWISVRDKTGKVQARWDAPRCHQICVDTHGDIFMVVGTGIAKAIRQR